jgi:hypothetical protein
MLETVIQAVIEAAILLSTGCATVITSAGSGLAGNFNKVRFQLVNATLLLLLKDSCVLRRPVETATHCRTWGYL